MQNHQQTGLFRTLGAGFLQRMLVIAALIGLAMPASTFAQASGGSIEGRVLNVGNSKYIVNARVMIEGTNRETFTDAFGQYRFDNVPAGEVRVKASYTGLDEDVATVTVVAGQAVNHTST